jgi:hypothetical protein
MEAPFETVKESPTDADILKQIEAEMNKSSRPSTTSGSTKDYYKMFVRKRSRKAINSQVISQTEPVLSHPTLDNS